MVEQTNGAISQAPGRKEECRRDSSVVFEYLSPIMIFYSYFPKQMDPYEWRTFPGSSSLQHPVRHSQPLDLFYYYENPVLISPVISRLAAFLSLCQKSELGYSPSSSYKPLALMAEWSISRMSSPPLSPPPLSPFQLWPHRIEQCISSYLVKDWSVFVLVFCCCCSCCSSQICHGPVLL